MSGHVAKRAAPACCRAVRELIAGILESEEGLEWAQSGQWRCLASLVRRDVRRAKTCWTEHWRLCVQLKTLL